MKNYKILLYNIQYLIGLDGTWQDFLFHGYRYLFCPKSVLQRDLANLQALIKKEDPDLCILIESETGKKFEQIHKTLCSYKFANCECKYGQHSIWRHFPWMKNRGNAILAKKNFPIKTHFLKNGTKKLVMEIQMEKDLSVFAVHAALTNKKVRQKQFDELGEMTKAKKRSILCGDLNTFGGLAELDLLQQKYDMKVFNTEKDKTYPRKNPQNVLDVFLGKGKFEQPKIKVLQNETISDHLPVVISFLA